MQHAIDRVCDDVNDSFRCGGKRRVVHLDRDNVAARSMRHISLSVGSYHSIPFRHKKPGRLLPPCWFGHLLPQTTDGDRLLRRHHHSSVPCGTLRSDCFGETICRHPEKPVFVGHKRRRARMRCCSV